MQVLQLLKSSNLRRIGSGLLVAAGLMWLAFYFLSTPIDIFKSEIYLAGLSDECKLLCDTNGFWQISAQNEVDLFRALGFLQAARQLDCMDYMLRAATGNLAAAYGPRALPADRFARTIGFEQNGAELLATLDSTNRNLLGAYAEGINQLISQHGRAVSVQWRLKRIAPLEWSAARVAAVAQLYAWLLSTDWESPLLLTKIAAIYGDEKVRAGFPLAGAFASQPMESVTNQFATLNQFYQDGKVLERWLLAGEYGGFFSELFSIDMLPDGISLKSHGLPWQRLIVRLHCPEFAALGYMLPGMPVMLAGRNKHLSWGLTWVREPALQLYLVPVDPRMQTYQRAGTDRQLRKLKYSIVVRGKKEVPVEQWQAGELPLIGVSGNQREAIGVDWGGKYTLELPFLLTLMRMPNSAVLPQVITGSRLPVMQLAWQDSQSGSGEFLVIGSPSQVRADWVPLVRYGYEPIAGEATHQPVSPLPMVPSPSGKNGSQKITTVPAAYQPSIDLAPALWETCHQLLQTVDAPLAQYGYRTLTNWIRQPVIGSPGAIFFTTFCEQLVAGIYSDELALVDDISLAQLQGLDHWLLANLTLMLQEGTSSWFDDLTTSDRVEFASEIIRKAWVATLNELKAQYGSDTVNYELAWQHFLGRRDDRDFWTYLFPGLQRMPNRFFTIGEIQSIYLPARAPQLDLYRFKANVRQRNWSWESYRIDCELQSAAKQSVTIIPQGQRQ